jgi:hypothetical protein
MALAITVPPIASADDDKALNPIPNEIRDEPQPANPTSDVPSSPPTNEEKDRDGLPDQRRNEPQPANPIPEVQSSPPASADKSRDLNGIPNESQEEPQPANPTADEDLDLGLIPSEIQDKTQPANPTPEAPASEPIRPRLNKKIFAEDAFTLASPPRLTPVPYPTTLSDWQNRTSLDLYLHLKPRGSVTITLSNRLNFLEQDNVSILSRQAARNDFREGYITWEMSASTYLEVGRINVRNGMALGFNPTDFFKTRTLVGQASLDPSTIRQNRLGTLMARGQRIWDGGSASIAFAPKMYEPSAIMSNDRLGVDPRFDATNAANRVLGTLSLDFVDFNPQVLGYFEHHRSKIGVNLSWPFGDAVIAYVEWAGGPETNLIARSFAYGQATGTLPPNAPLLLPTDTGTTFRNDIAAGASWTIASKITLNSEYHFHQAGFTHQDWRNWFDMGSSPTSPPAAASALWYIRGYASDQQEPMSRHQLFVRVSWPRAFVSELELGGFALVNLLDGSTLSQVLVSYYLSDTWTLVAYGSMNFGSARSERGSLPQLGSGILQVVRYF